MNFRKPTRTELIKQIENIERQLLTHDLHHQEKINLECIKSQYIKIYEIKTGRKYLIGN